MVLIDPLGIYAIILGGIILIPFINNAVKNVLSLIIRRAIFFALKHLIYPLMLKKYSRYLKYSRFWGLAQLLYWTGTLTANFIGTHDLSQIQKRAGVLAMINMLPLALNRRLDFLARILGLPILFISHCHSTLGIMTLLQSLFHMSLALYRAKLDIKSKIQLYGIIVRGGYVQRKEILS